MNLDLAEIFKPVIIDKVIFSLINRREIHAKNHFRQTDDGGIYLSDEGKRLLVSGFEYKLDQSITVGGKRMTYRRLVREETRKIQQSIIRDDAYKPFKYSN